MPTSVNDDGAAPTAGSAESSDVSGPSRAPEQQQQTKAKSPDADHDNNATSAKWQPDDQQHRGGKKRKTCSADDASSSCPRQASAAGDASQPGRAGDLAEQDTSLASRTRSGKKKQNGATAAITPQPERSKRPSKDHAGIPSNAGDPRTPAAAPGPKDTSAAVTDVSNTPGGRSGGPPLPTPGRGGASPSIASGRRGAPSALIQKLYPSQEKPPSDSILGAPDGEEEDNLQDDPAGESYTIEITPMDQISRHPLGLQFKEKGGRIVFDRFATKEARSKWRATVRQGDVLVSIEGNDLVADNETSTDKMEIIDEIVKGALEFGDPVTLDFCMVGSGGGVYSTRPKIPDHERESFTEAQQTGLIDCPSIMDLISHSRIGMFHDNLDRRMKDHASSVPGAEMETKHLHLKDYERAEQFILYVGSKRKKRYRHPGGRRFDHFADGPFDEFIDKANQLDDMSKLSMSYTNGSGTEVTVNFDDFDVSADFDAWFRVDGKGMSVLEGLKLWREEESNRRKRKRKRERERGRCSSLLTLAMGARHCTKSKKPRAAKKKDSEWKRIACGECDGCTRRACGRCDACTKSPKKRCLDRPCSNMMWVDKTEYVEWKKDKKSGPRPTGPKKRPQSHRGGSQAWAKLEEVAAGGEPVTSFSQNDVLCGRGGTVNGHAGNKRHRSLVNEMKAEYLSPSARKDHEKTQIVAQIVRAVRQSDPPGRFLKADPGTGAWYEIGDKAAFRKTGQALRENGNAKRDAKRRAGCYL